MKIYPKIFQTVLIGAITFGIFSTTRATNNTQATTTITVSDTVVGTKQNVALNVNPYNLDYEHAYWTANMIPNPSFETRWFGNSSGDSATHLASSLSSPWWVESAKWGETIQGNVTATTDTTEKISGGSSQKLTINLNFTSDVDLGMWPKEPILVAGRTYRAKVQVKGDPGGTVRIGLGTIGAGWVYSNPFSINNSWQILSFDCIPANNISLQTLALRISAKGDIWVDDFIFWDVNDIDSDGLSKSLIERTKEVKPSMLRWGSLYVNEISLPRATFRPWGISYGPPPDFDIASFLLFTKKVGAIPFITVPPAFTDENFRSNILPQLREAQKNQDYSVLPSLVDQLEASFQEHLDFLDYLSARAGTTYGNLAISQGFSDWSQQFNNVYFELGNELWNSMSKPYYMWDGVKLTDNYGNYCLNRMKAMKVHPAWKSNYKVGFNNQWGNWTASKPSQWSWAPVVAGYTKDYVDFYSDAPYYPNYYLPSDWATLTSQPDDETIYSAIYVSSEKFAQDIPYQYALVKNAAGRDVEHIWYEINVEIRCDSNYVRQVQKDYNPLFFKQHGIGSAVARLDNHARFPLLNITYANHYQELSRDLYGAHLGYPDYGRRPEWFAFQMLSKTGSQMFQTTVSGSPTWNDPTTNLTNLPYIHAYGYKEANKYDVLIINRNRNNSHAVTINLPANSYSNNATLYMLTSGNINDNNDDPDVEVDKIYENVVLTNQIINDFSNGYTLTIPPFSAYLLHVNLTEVPTLEGEEFASDLSRVKAYPNPYRGDKHSQVIFDNLTANVKIRIYTLTGELVREIREQDGDRAYWDVRNKDGERVSSGIYIYHITNSKGEEKKGKVAVIK